MQPALEFPYAGSDTPSITLAGKIPQEKCFIIRGTIIVIKAQLNWAALYLFIVKCN